MVKEYQLQLRKPYLVDFHLACFVIRQPQAASGNFSGEAAKQGRSKEYINYNLDQVEIAQMVSPGYGGDFDNLVAKKFIDKFPYSNYQNSHHYQNSTLLPFSK